MARLTLLVAMIAAMLYCPASRVWAQNDAGGNDSNSQTQAQLVFKVATPKDLSGKAAEGTWISGPQPPTYPGFDPKNQALDLTKGNGFLIPESKFDPARLRFAQGETITLEAWVRCEGLSEGAYAYLIGKGRNRKEGFPELNQNWALRLAGKSGKARVSFLFASAPADSKPAQWHRWISSDGFAPGKKWHHVAIVYTFGDPKSIKGFVDGKKFDGAWDMGGPTTRAPVVDGDDISLGTGNGGGKSNSLQGALDELAVWRGALPDSVLTGRFAYVPPVPLTRKDTFPTSGIRVELCDRDIPTGSAWPEEAVFPSETYEEKAFGLFRFPARYIETGIRADRGNPMMVRALAQVKFPEGKHRFLLRSRGASRLSLNGQLILSNPFPPRDSSGHGPIHPPESYLDLGPDFRFAPPGNRESWIHYTIKGSAPVSVLLETIVGGGPGNARRRPEPGETVVAWSPQGQDRWFLVNPDGGQLPYTDAGWQGYTEQASRRLDQIDRTNRQKALSNSEGYWKARREYAREIAQEKLKELGTPAAPSQANSPTNPIDQELAASLREATLVNSSANESVALAARNLIKERCSQCHQGSKARGGLDVESKESLLKGGDSGPAIQLDRWETSRLLTRVKTSDPETRMPPKGDRLSPGEIATLEDWLKAGAPQARESIASVALAPLCDDHTYLRRIHFDLVGVPPGLEEIKRYLGDPPQTRRAQAVERLLADSRRADRAMGFWLDMLAENPNILNPTLNNTGPFRWWIYESLKDDKPLDLMVTELMGMGGSERYGGPAGFATASQNDVPLAQKGTIVAMAFMGEQMKCARCHDSPSGRWLQADLFGLAAMLANKPIAVPASSSIPMDRIHQEGRKALVQVTLKTGSKVEPKWPFADKVDPKWMALARPKEGSGRDLLAARLTAPQNERFAQVAVNRMWRSLMGTGLVEPPDDWEKAKPIHPRLLQRLAWTWVASGYDDRAILRLILSSEAYQRATDSRLAGPDPYHRARHPKRFDAEQIVDGLFFATGKPMKLEEVSLDVDGIREEGNSISLGVPRRAWMLTSTSNERDRPSLSLPRIQAVCDTLTAFGWRGARQDPLLVRDDAPDVIQPAILAHGTMGHWLTTLSDDHEVTRLALAIESVDQVVDQLFLRVLTRPPTPAEKAHFSQLLEPGFAMRLVQNPSLPAQPTPRKPRPYVSWSNHLDPGATLLRQKEEIEAKAGDPPTQKLAPAWRESLENALWALINSPETIHLR